MTFEDAIKSNPTFIDVPERALELACINRGVDWTVDYDSSLLQSLELVSADVYVEMATTPNFTEGDLSVSADKNILLMRARNIYLKYDDPKVEETGLTPIQVRVRRYE